MKYLDQWTQQDWDQFSQNLANALGVEYTPTPFQPLEAEAGHSNFDWTGLKHTDATKAMMRENWDDNYRNPKTLAKYSASAKKRCANPDWVWYTEDYKRAQATKIHNLWYNPSSGYHNLKGQYIVTDPSGNAYHVQGLKQFCREHGLENKYMARQANGRKSTPYKGWTCRKSLAT